MKRILFLFLALALLLSFAGCGKSENGESSPDATDETSDGKVIQTKYFGDVTEATDSEGKVYRTVKAENWTAFKDEDLNEEFFANIDTEWAEICSDVSYVKLLLESGSSISVQTSGEMPTRFGEEKIYNVSFPFGTYKFATGGEFHIWTPEINEEALVFRSGEAVNSASESVEITTERASALLKFFRLLYGLRPAADKVYSMCLTSGRDSVCPVVVYNGSIGAALLDLSPNALRMCDVERPLGIIPESSEGLE